MTADPATVLIGPGTWVWDTCQFTLAPGPTALSLGQMGTRIEQKGGDRRVGRPQEEGMGYMQHNSICPHLHPATSPRLTVVRGPHWHPRDRRLSGGLGVAFCSVQRSLRQTGPHKASPMCSPPHWAISVTLPASSRHPGRWASLLEAETAAQHGPELCQLERFQGQLETRQPGHLYCT